MVSNIRLQQFRSYKDTSFEFDDGVNIIVGPNASGKTNLLEAILVVARGGSYRAQPSELIMHGKDWARLDADVKSEHRTVKIQKTAGVTKKSLTIDQKDYTRPGQKQLIPVVLFEPNHLLMLGGSPDLRRDFMDDLISQVKPEYAPILRQYKRALRQRNRLLKSSEGQADLSQLFVWDLRLSELASKIVEARQKLLTQVNESLAPTYSQLAGKTNKLDVVYSYSGDPAIYASTLLKKLESNRQLDLARGFTGAGPHREDMLISLGGNSLATTASRGENRTTLLSLKTIELQIIEAARATKPLLLLDDVFSELDGSRRRALTQLMSDHQTFITTTDADIIAKNFAQHANVIPLSGR